MEETVTTRKVAMDESIQTKDLTIIETIIPIAPQYSPVAPPIVENESSEMPTVPTSSSVAHEERAVKVQAASHIDDDLPSAKEKTESVNVKNHSIEILAALSTSIERFARSKYSAMLTMDQVEDRIKDIKDEAAILKQIISKKEVEQLKLAEIEEFEKADDLTNEILALQNRKESLEGQTISLAEEYETSRKHFEMLKLDYKLEFTTFVEVLSVNETQLDAESAKIKRINQHKLDIDRSRLKSETERMQIERKHFEEEREALLYDSKVVEDTISSQSGDLENEKFDVDTSILGVQCEIRELEEKLAAKRLEEKNLLEKSSIIDSQIEDIRKKFKRQLDDISDRREKIDLAQKEYSDSEERLLAEQREFDLFSTKVENEYDNAKLLARAVRINCAIIEILTNHIVSESADENHVYSSDLSQQARIEYNQAVSLVEDCKNSKLSKEHCIQKLLSEISYIDSTIPSLETEKKNYASSKRFKEAAVSAKEIKDLLTKKDDITLELEALRLSLEKYDEELKDLENDASRKMELIVASEKDANVDRYNNLYRRCKRLKDVILAIDVEKSKLDGGSCLDSSAFTVALTSKSYLQEELQRIEDDLSAISAKYPNENFSDQTSEMDAIHQEEVMAECQDEDIANSTIEADEIVISHMDTIIQMDTSNTDEIKNLAENYPDDQSSNNNTLRLQAIVSLTFLACIIDYFIYVLLEITLPL